MYIACYIRLLVKFLPNIDTTLNIFKIIAGFGLAMKSSGSTQIAVVLAKNDGSGDKACILDKAATVQPESVRSSIRLRAVLALVAFLGSSLSNELSAGVVSNWVVWTGAPASYPNPGTEPWWSWAEEASGTLVDPVTNEVINVTYTGEVTSFSEFNNPSGNALFDFEAYDGPTVASRPPAGNFIATSGYSVASQKLVFDKPVTNLMLAIASLGDETDASSYLFDRTAVVASTGQGNWGNGPMYMSTPFEVYGLEGNGIVQFTGTFSELNWTVTRSEIYSAFNVGISNTSAASAVPEPTSIAIFGLGALGMAYRARRKRKA